MTDAKRAQTTFLALLVLLFGTQCSSTRLSGATGVLDASITESSGLIRSTIDPSLFWTLNDSGNTPHIFAVDLGGNGHATVGIDGTENIDWEAITTDNRGSLFIGDFGNNANARRDLVIHEIDEPNPRGAGTVPIRRSIRFRFEDQHEFPDPDRMNFDAEAMFWDGGKLYILSKHRSDSETTLYSIDPGEGSGEIVAKKISTADPGSMVTDAALWSDGRTLAVLTYTGLHLFERSGENFLANHIRQIRFHTSVTLQCEGVAWTKDGAIVFTNEQRAIHVIESPFDRSVLTYPDPRRM
ncbi:MAG: hypothetical protein KY459_16050 [Acidobacteria bacterium]|nr:hypothetical protein [Acidobacteriota bacterium]